MYSDIKDYLENFPGYDPEENKKRRNSFFSNNFNVNKSNSSSKSFMDTMKDFNDYKQNHSLHFPLQDYLDGTPAGDTLNKVVNGIDKYFDANPTVFDAVGDVVSVVGDVISGDFSGFDGNTSQTGSSAKPVIYSNWSPASKLFGMSQETAFGEHMANTAHQREVADLKAAGLNPVLGISGSGATSVSGSTGASSSAEKVQDNSMLDVLGATAAVITAVATKNPMYGYMVSNIFKAFE